MTTDTMEFGLIGPRDTSAHPAAATECPDAQDRALLARYLDSGRHRDFLPLHDRLAVTVQIACARALRADPHRRGRSLLPDLMQEAWLHLVANEARVLRGFEPGRGTLRGYVSRVAENRARDRLRAASLGDAVHRGVVPEEHHRVAPSPLAEVEARESLEKLDAALERELPASKYGLFRALFMDEDEAADASARSGLTHNYVLKCKASIRGIARAWRKGNHGDDDR